MGDYLCCPTRIIFVSYMRTRLVSISIIVCVQSQDYVSVSAPFYHHCNGGSLHWYCGLTFCISLEYFWFFLHQLNKIPCLHTCTQSKTHGANYSTTFKQTLMKENWFPAVRVGILTEKILLIQ